MKTSLVKYVLYDILQNRIVIAYTVFLFAVSMGLFALSDQPAQGLISLLNIVLIVVPLVSLIFSTIHLYNAADFIELLAAQPLKRSAILWSEFWGLALAMITAITLGVGIPVLVYAANATGFSLLGTALALTLVFIALAFWASVATRDKARGIGVALLTWFYFALLYDALVLFILFGFADYPLEKATLALMSLNPATPKPGFARVEGEDGAWVTAAAALSPGQAVSLVFPDGATGAVIDGEPPSPRVRAATPRAKPPAAGQGSLFQGHEKAGPLLTVQEEGALIGEVLRISDVPIGSQAKLQAQERCVGGLLDDDLPGSEDEELQLI